MCMIDTTPKKFTHCEKCYYSYAHCWCYSDCDCGCYGAALYHLAFEAVQKVVEIGNTPFLSRLTFQEKLEEAMEEAEKWNKAWEESRAWAQHEYDPAEIGDALFADSLYWMDEELEMEEYNPCLMEELEMEEYNPCPMEVDMSRKEIRMNRRKAEAKAKKRAKKNYELVYLSSSWRRTFRECYFHDPLHQMDKRVDEFVDYPPKRTLSRWTIFREISQDLIMARDLQEEGAKEAEADLKDLFDPSTYCADDSPTYPDPWDLMEDDQFFDDDVISEDPIRDVQFWG